MAGGVPLEQLRDMYRIYRVSQPPPAPANMPPHPEGAPPPPPPQQRPPTVAEPSLDTATAHASDAADEQLRGRPGAHGGGAGTRRSQPSYRRIGGSGPTGNADPCPIDDSQLERCSGGGGGNAGTRWLGGRPQGMGDLGTQSRLRNLQLHGEQSRCKRHRCRKGCLLITSRNARSPRTQRFHAQCANGDPRRRGRQR